MKKLILLVCFVFASNQSFSQLAIENFTFDVDELLTDNGWDNIGGTGLFLVATDNGLSFPNYAGSGILNATTLTLPTASAQDVYLPFASVTSNSVYASFMLNVSEASTLGSYPVALLPSNSLTNFNGRVFAQEDAGGNLELGLSKNSNTATYDPTDYLYNTTYLLVLKYTFNTGTGTDDEVSLFIFSGSLPASEPATPTIGPLTGGTDPIDITRFALRQANSTTTGNTPTAIVDGIYVDVTWNDLVLPVELSSFTSVINKRDVTLNWTTASERNNSGFEIERSSANSSFTKVGSVAGNGTINSASNYSYTDRGLATGNYSYRLKQIDFNGNFEYFNLNNEVNIGIPTNYDMSQNYPNPFNPTTNINFDLPSDGNVSIKLFDMSGKEVASIINEVKTAGYYSVNFNASSLSSGVYFYSISANNFTATKKMLLLK